MTWSLDSEETLELDEIQGHVLIGFGSAMQVLAAFSAADLQAAARTVGRWAGRVTSAKSLLVRKGRSARDIVNAAGPWLTISVSKRLLDSGKKPSAFGDDLFAAQSMAEAAELLDPPPDDGTATGTDWLVGSPNAPVDVLLIVAAGTLDAAEEIVGWFTSDARSWLAQSPFVERLLPIEGGEEHFGFRDGISQPSFFGTYDGTVFDADRLPKDDPPRTNKGQDLLWPGSFVFGYKGQSAWSHLQPGDTVSPEDESAAAFARNGSLLVYRRLAQDVAAFREYFESVSMALREKHPELTPEYLQAMVVGRQKDGMPIALRADKSAASEFALNDFNFYHDAMDTGCPYAAHIRKVNPRRGQSDFPVVPRLIRRGAPFGPPYRDIGKMRQILPSTEEAWSFWPIKPVLCASSDVSNRTG